LNRVDSTLRVTLVQCKLGRSSRRDREAIDVFLAEEHAHRALDDCLRDEPHWRGLLRAEGFELEASAHLN
jgi:hypothetical protein